MKSFYIIFFSLLVILLGYGIWYGFSNSTPTVSVNDPNRPIIEVKETTFDLGKMNVQDIKDHEFTVTNKGKSNLVLKQFTTSCGCTYANVIQDGVKSPKFSMHINSEWQTNLEPEKSLTVKTVYDPSAMPVEGKVERVISFATDDPLKPTVELKLVAEVSK